MIRSDVISHAANECMKELYSITQPTVLWEDFVEENRIYSKRYKEWEIFNNAYFRREEHPVEWDKLKKLHPDWEGKSRKECLGPSPYEFYYIPRKIMNEICENYIHAYKLDNQKELLDTIETLKNYCKEPIVDKWIERNGDEPGYRGYDHPDNLEKEIQKLIQEYDSSDISKEISEKCCNKFFEFLDMAGNFYNWNKDLNTFNTTVYLGPSPNSNKEAVIENWKKYRGKDIEINDEQIEKYYYGNDE